MAGPHISRSPVSSTRDIGGAKSCGCDTSINHTCDRHIIDRLEQEVQGLRDRLIDIGCWALTGESTAASAWHRHQYHIIRERTKFNREER